MGATVSTISPGRIVTFCKDKLEFVVAALVLLEGLQFIVSFFGMHLPGVGAFIENNTAGILAGLSSISLVILIFTVIALRKEIEIRHETESKITQIDGQYRLEIAELRNVFESENLKLSTSLAEYRNFHGKFHSCGQKYRTFAKMNAECDWNLFNILFIDTLRSPTEISQFLNDAIGVIRRNIIEILNMSSQILTIHSGNTCAACIQIMEFKEGTDLNSAIIRTVARDEDSHERRVMSTIVDHHVKDNTIHQKIFIDREPFVLINDLEREKRENPEFKTTSQRLANVYNALLIVPIPNMPSPGRPRVFDTTAWERPRATLCIDNRGGGFREEPHIQFAQEFAWRLGVMLYRLNRLEAVLETQGLDHGHR